MTELEKACLKLSRTGYAKVFGKEIKVSFNDKYNQELFLDAKVLWTLDEVKLFNEQGFIEFKDEWKPGDILRNTITMKKVTFNGFSHGKEWFFAEDRRPALKSCNYTRLLEDQE